MKLTFPDGTTRIVDRLTIEDVAVVPPDPPPVDEPPVVAPPGVMVFALGQRDDLYNIAFSEVFVKQGLAMDSLVPAGVTKAYAFRNDNPARMTGKFSIAPGNRGTNPKDVAISTEPGKFDVPAASMGYLSGNIYWTFNGAKYAGLITAAKVEQGVTYYLNIRASDPAQDAGYAINSQ